MERTEQYIDSLLNTIRTSLPNFAKQTLSDALRDQAADAQATIAALEAEVKDLKEWLGAYKQSIELAQSEITQRTAELEAANEKVQFLEKKNSNLLDSSNTVLKVKADQDVRLADLQAELERVRGELAKMRERKDGAYLERNRVVAALASCFPSGISRTAIEGWHDDWHGCVYIDLPTGQVSWHYHDSHAHLFAHLPPYTKQWDGHTTEEKYERVALLQHRQGMEG